MKITNIEAIDIPDAWFQCVAEVQEVGFKYEIEQGSFVGQTRLEFDWITVSIKHAYREPYDLMLPEIPDHLGIPNPVEKGYIEQYMPYIMTAELLPDEQYTYGSRIYEEVFGGFRTQYEQIRNLLSHTPKTNQAILQVAKPSDCMLDDPPCLRHIDIRVKGEQLIFYPYFRSWDLWNGFPANLAAIAVLQKYMADELVIDIGPIVAASKGLHIYGYAEELAKVRVGK